MGVLNLHWRDMQLLIQERKSFLASSATKNLLLSNIKRSMSTFIQMRLLMSVVLMVVQKHLDREQSYVYIEWTIRRIKRKATEYFLEKILLKLQNKINMFKKLLHKWGMKNLFNDIEKCLLKYFYLFINFKI